MAGPSCILPGFIMWASFFSEASSGAVGVLNILCVSLPTRARSEPKVAPSVAPVELGGEVVARKQQQESTADVD